MNTHKAKYALPEVACIVTMSQTLDGSSIP